jgi:polysaccharide export outer membrane protein
MCRLTRTIIVCSLWLISAATIGCESLGISPPANQLLRDTKDIRDSAPMPAPVPRELAKELHGPYVVEPGDTLLVQPANLDAPVRLPPDQTIFPDGTIDLGIYGRPVVAGKTLAEIEPEVRKIVNDKEKAKEPIAITVRLIGRNSKVYYVLGEVNAPGMFPITGSETVLDGIVKAGGITKRASEQMIVLSRPTVPEGCRIVYPVCYTNIVQLGDTTTNYQLQPGDRIYVPGSGIFEALFQNRCRRNGPCRQPQVGCWNGACRSSSGCATGGVALPAPVSGRMPSPAPAGLLSMPTAVNGGIPSMPGTGVLSLPPMLTGGIALPPLMTN